MPSPIRLCTSDTVMPRATGPRYLPSRSEDFCGVGSTDIFCVGDAVGLAEILRCWFRSRAPIKPPTRKRAANPATRTVRRDLFFLLLGKCKSFPGETGA